MYTEGKVARECPWSGCPGNHGDIGVLVQREVDNDCGREGVREREREREEGYVRGVWETM